MKLLEYVKTAKRRNGVQRVYLNSDLELSNWTAIDEGGTHSREMADIFQQHPRW